jgi:protein-arginine kinase activator protein McsA
MLCDVCHTRPAVNHTTTVTDGVTRTRDLCEECYQTTSTPAEREFAANLRSARCYFCGAAINVGGTDPLAQRFGVHRTRFFCFRCSPIYGNCVARALATVPRDLPAEQQPALLAQLTEDVDKQVRQRLGEQQ